MAVLVIINFVEVCMCVLLSTAGTHVRDKVSTEGHRPVCRRVSDALSADRRVSYNLVNLPAHVTLSGSTTNCKGKELKSLVNLKPVLGCIRQRSLQLLEVCGSQILDQSFCEFVMDRWI